MQELITEVKELRGDVANLNKRAGEFEKRKSLRVDPKYSIAKQPEGARPHLERLEKLLVEEQKINVKTVTSKMSGPTVAALEGYKERFGRDSGYWTMPLRVLARLTGAPYSRDASRHLLTTLKPQLTVEASGFRGLQEDALTAAGNDYNRKEETLSHGEIACEMEDLFDNLGSNAENDALFHFYLDYLQNDYEAKWLKKYGFRVPEHRTLHSALQELRYHLRLFKFTGDAWYQAEAKKLAPLIRQELQYATVGGVEYVAVTWRVRAFEPVASKSDPEQFHMSVYFLGLDVGQIVDLALWDVPEFADERLLKALANTVEAMLEDVTWKTKDGRSGKGAMHKDCGAFWNTRTDENEKPPKPVKFGDRMYSEGWFDDGFFKPVEALLNYPTALILPWASEGLRKRYEGLYKSSNTDPSHATIPASFAFVELWEAGGLRL